MDNGQQSHDTCPILEVDLGDLVVVQRNQTTRLCTVPVTSAVAILLVLRNADPADGMAAAALALPIQPGRDPIDGIPDALLVERAAAQLLERLAAESDDFDRQRVDVLLVGGADALESTDSAVGARNVAAARAYFEKAGYTVSTEHTADRCRRVLRVDLLSGSTEVTIPRVDRQGITS